MDLTIASPRSSAELPGIDQLWSIEPAALQQMQAEIRASGHMHTMRVPEGREFNVPVARIGRVAVIDIMGPMTKRASLYHYYFTATSTEMVRAAIQQAAGDDDIKAILLRIDSPGGSVDGLAELADAIFEARQKTRVVGQVDGMMASAAYYVGSQCDTLYAHRMNMVGSIGTRLMLYDFSKMFSDAGIEAIPIDTGEYKSAGAMGTEITERHREYFQSIVDVYQSDFLAMIHRGRDISKEQLQEVADGRMFPAAVAKKSKLIDGIQTLDETLTKLQEGRLRKKQMKAAVVLDPASEAEEADDEPETDDSAESEEQSVPAAEETEAPTVETSADTEGKDSTMSEPTAPAAPQPASYAEIVEACDGIDAKGNGDDSRFVCDQMEQNATVAQAQKAWMGTLKARADSREQEAAELREAQQKQTTQQQATAGKPGVVTIEEGGGSSASDSFDDPKSEFEAVVDANMKRGMKRPKAVSKAVKENPELHAAMLDTHNSEHGRTASLPAAYAS